ncbi:unnamed protein product [Merluccius merluccius]
MLIQLGCNHGDAITASARAVSGVQAIMASSAGIVIVTSCQDVMMDRHWLSEGYVLFATPYFVFDVYAMFLCYRHKLQVKGRFERLVLELTNDMNAAVKLIWPSHQHRSGPFQDRPVSPARPGVTCLEVLLAGQCTFSPLRTQTCARARCRPRPFLPGLHLCSRSETTPPRRPVFGGIFEEAAGV